MLYSKKEKYKYVLEREVKLDLVHFFEIKELKNWDRGMVTKGFFTLFKYNLIIRKGYSWNGANVLIDTKKNMTPSLIHDALYQLLREDILPKEEKNKIDDLFVRMCEIRGVNKLLCWCYKKALLWRGSYKNKKEVI